MRKTIARMVFVFHESAILNDELIKQYFTACMNVITGADENI